MNPVIHHPLWYASKKIIDEEVANVALSNNSICSPDISLQKFERFEIKCQRERWDIISKDIHSFDQILSIADITFKILDETPVSAFGFNINKHFPINSESPSKKIYETFINKSNLEGVSESLKSSISLKHENSISENTITIEQSRLSSDHVFIGQNFNFEVSKLIGKDFQNFDLGHFLKKFKDFVFSESDRVENLLLGKLV